MRMIQEPGKPIGIHGIGRGGSQSGWQLVAFIGALLKLFGLLLEGRSFCPSVLRNVVPCVATVMLCPEEHDWHQLSSTVCYWLPGDGFVRPSARIDPTRNMLLGREGLLCQGRSKSVYRSRVPRFTLTAPCCVGPPQANGDEKRSHGFPEPSLTSRLPELFASILDLRALRILRRVGDRRKISRTTGFAGDISDSRALRRFYLIRRSTEIFLLRSGDTPETVDTPGLIDYRDNP